MKILVTGGCGYIGSMLTPSLLNCGHKVTVLDSFRYKQTPHLDSCSNSNFDIIVGDCRDKEIMAPLIKNHDAVIHLAAIVGVDACKLSLFDAKTINVDATKLIVNNLSKDQLIIFLCTNSGYGIGQEGIYCTEESPLRPLSVYGKTKVEAEQIVMERENSISFRLATVFGSSPCFRAELLVNDFVRRAIFYKAVNLFEPHFKRNYIHIKDVVQAILLGISNASTMKSNVYNVGLSSANLSKAELCEVIKKYLQFDVIVVDGKDPDQRNYIVSNDKIEKCGFNPQYTIDMGVQELIKTYRITNRSYYFR